MTEDEDIVREFLAESHENLARLDQEIVQLENHPHDSELLASIFRTVHTIKGTCGFLGFSTLGTIAHNAETILSQLRAGKRVADVDTISLILQVVDATRAILRSIEADGREGEANYQDLVLRLQEAAGNSSPRTVAVRSTATPEPSNAPISDNKASITQQIPKSPADWTPETPALDATVRLNVGVLDTLMNLAGELVLGRNQLNDAIGRHDPALIQAASQRLGAITAEVQDAVMRTRMQPVAQLFQRFPRLVRDTALKLGKQVNLVEEGSDVELDKTILEGLSDPLTHMVRNAIDHGIESAAERVAQGKPAAGTVCMRAWHEAGLVAVEVTDDGRGLDPNHIGNTAVARGIISAQANSAMTSEEKLALIFRPGFSTAARVSDISGRGVGLDVVKTNLDLMGGKVEFQSQPGKGTTFRVRLPLTLAVIPSLLVSAGADRVAIPLANVQELVRVPGPEIPNRIDRVGSAGVLLLRDSVVPLVDLAGVLELPASADGAAGAAMNIVILKGGPYLYGLVVARLHGTVDIVSKPLGRHIKHLREYAGATILGDGSVALILDVAGLAAVAGLRSAESYTQAACDAASPAPETHQMLLFHNGPAEPCVLPLTAVVNVLTIQPEQVDRIGGRRSMPYRGFTLPLLTLADVAQAAEARLDRDSIVIVIEHSGRQFGLLASSPADVTEVALNIDTETMRQPGVAGSVMLCGRTTLVLDAAELAYAALDPAREVPLPENPPGLRSANGSSARSRIEFSEVLSH